MLHFICSVILFTFSWSSFSGYILTSDEDKYVARSSISFEEFWEKYDHQSTFYRGFSCQNGPRLGKLVRYFEGLWLYHQEYQKRGPAFFLPTPSMKAMVQQKSEERAQKNLSYQKSSADRLKDKRDAAWHNMDKLELISNNNHVLSVKNIFQINNVLLANKDEEFAEFLYMKKKEIFGKYLDEVNAESRSELDFFLNSTLLLLGELKTLNQSKLSSFGFNDEIYQKILKIEHYEKILPALLTSFYVVLSLPKRRIKFAPEQAIAFMDIMQEISKNTLDLFVEWSEENWTDESYENLRRQNVLNFYFQFSNLSKHIFDYFSQNNIINSLHKLNSENKEIYRHAFDDNGQKNTKVYVFARVFSQEDRILIVYNNNLDTTISFKIWDQQEALASASGGYKTFSIKNGAFQSKIQENHEEALLEDARSEEDDNDYNNNQLMEDKDEYSVAARLKLKTQGKAKPEKSHDYYPAREAQKKKSSKVNQEKLVKNVLKIIGFDEKQKSQPIKPRVYDRYRTAIDNYFQNIQKNASRKGSHTTYHLPKGFVINDKVHGPSAGKIYGKRVIEYAESWVKAIHDQH